MRTRTRNLKRLLSLALCLCMVTGLLPMAALAADAPVITTESLAKATVGEEYTAALEAEASDPNGELIWSATGLPQWLTLTDNTDGTATLTGTPGEAGEVKFTVTVTETIPAAAQEEPAEGTEPAAPTVLTASKEYTLTVVEAVQAEPEPEPGITNGITPLAVTNKVQLDFNLYLQPADGGSLNLDRDKITWFSAGNRLYLRMNNYPGTNPTKIALISSSLDVGNLDETDLDNNAMVLAVGGDSGNGSMTVSDRILMVTNFQTIDSNESAPTGLADGYRYRFLIWDGADGGDQTVYYSSETYTYTTDNAIPMTVTKGEQSVTSFANTDTITITATLPTAPTSVTSVFFVDSQYATNETYMYLADDSVTLRENTVTITMNGLYEGKSYAPGTKDGLIMPGTYNIILYGDSSTGEIKYVSTTSYTVTGEGGTGNNTCSVSFATDPNFENPVTSVTPGSTKYYVRATDFSPALPYGSQYGVMIQATGSSAVYTLTGTPSSEQDASGNTAYLQRGPIVFQLGGQNTEPAAGTYDLTVSVYESAGMTGEPLYTYTSTNRMVVTETSVSMPTITTNSPLPGGVTGTAYSQTLQATPGTEGKTITWSITANKPDWLSIDANTGVLSGTPTAAGSYTFTVTATEADGGTTSKSFTIVITQAITSTGLTVTGGSYSPGDKISVYWNMSASLPGDAAATLTLHYTDTSNAEKSATRSMTRYYNYFYAYVELPEGCASVQKVSAEAKVSGQTVTGENTNPGITMKGKLRLTWDSLSTSGTLTIKNSNETVATRSLYSGSTGLELSLPEGTYTLSAVAYVSGLGNQILLEETTVTVRGGATTAQTLSFKTLQAVTYTPKVQLPNGDFTSSCSLYWYSDAEGKALLATGRSYTALSTDTPYVKAVPRGNLSATHEASTLTQVTAANKTPTLSLEAKDTASVTVTVQCEDVTGVGGTLDKVSGYVVLSQPGADGYKKTTQKRVYDDGEVIFEGVTAGSTITFTPDQKYGCGPVSKIIDSVTGSTQSITLKAGALKGVITSNITLQYPNRTTNLTFTSTSDLKVKKDDGTVIPHHRISGNILVLDDLSGLKGGDTLTISGQYGSGDFPTAVFKETVTLSRDGKLSATADITMAARGTAQIRAQNQSRVAADLLLYQGDDLFYTKETFTASYANTSDYAYISGWSPRLPAGSYTVYLVNRDYLRTVDPTTYQMKDDIKFEEGTYSSADFTIRNNETTSVTLKVPDVAQAYADVNFEMSSVTMSVDFPGTFTHTTVITLTGDEQLDKTKDITLYLYNKQVSNAAALQSLTINGIPYKDHLDSIYGSVTLTFEEDELQKLYGGFPLRVSYVMARYDYWGAEAVDFAVSRELFAGTSATTFSPDTAMTRAMIVTVLARFEGVDTTTGDTWYEAGRQWAMENGVSDGTNMDASLTREQLATMLWRYAGSPSASNDLSNYTDAGTVSSYAQQAMAWCVEQGIIGGTTTTTLSPQGPATRAQVATILMRFIEGTA